MPARASAHRLCSERLKRRSLLLSWRLLRLLGTARESVVHGGLLCLHVLHLACHHCSVPMAATLGLGLLHALAPLAALAAGRSPSARALAPSVLVSRPLLGRISAPRRAGHFPGCRLAPLLLTGPCRYFRSVGRTTLCENQPVATVARSADSCSRGPQRGLSEVIHRYHAALSLSQECLYVDSRTGNHPAVGRITTSPYILTHHPRGASGTA